MSDYDHEEDIAEMTLRINEKGEAEEVEPIYMSKKDFEKLQKGLTLLAEKYPEISKECFPDE